MMTISSTVKSISRLEWLPLEIVQNIASQCTIETLTSLSLCNHFWHEICRDPVVIRRFVANRNGYETVIKEPLDTSFLSPNTSVAILVRYADADAKAQAWTPSYKLQENNLEDAPVDLDFLDWAAPLADLGHPFIRSWEPVPFIRWLCTTDREHFRAPVFQLPLSRVSCDSVSP